MLYGMDWMKTAAKSRRLPEGCDGSHGSHFAKMA
jgi:hypothetical protein